MYDAIIPILDEEKVVTRIAIKIEAEVYDYSHSYYVVASDSLDDDIHVGIYVDACKETAI
ncbi:hypothetical protein [Metabacillus fastidiosus]|uniref:hypothetical protein n=1 Tax=Metabacillus fastidiosus TaxID=1458 RepID=UPI003D27F02C